MYTIFYQKPTAGKQCVASLLKYLTITTNELFAISSVKAAATNYQIEHLYIPSPLVNVTRGILPIMKHMKI